MWWILLQQIYISSTFITRINVKNVISSKNKITICLYFEKAGNHIICCLTIYIDIDIWISKSKNMYVIISGEKKDGKGMRNKA